MEFRGQLLGVGSLPYGTEASPQVVRSVLKHLGTEHQKSALCTPVNRSFLMILITTSVGRREAIYPFLNR